MGIPLEELKKQITQNRMALPQICQQCPYRRTLQQLLGLWDQNLMKEQGIRSKDETIQKLRQEIERLRKENKKQSEE